MFKPDFFPVAERRVRHCERVTGTRSGKNDLFLWDMELLHLNLITMIINL